MRRIHPEIDDQQPRTCSDGLTGLTQEALVALGHKHVDDVSEQHSVMAGRQWILEEITLEDFNLRALRMIRKPPASDSSSRRQFIQRALQVWIKQQQRFQKGTRSAT
jgi:hypothetical protein